MKNLNFRKQHRTITAENDTDLYMVRFTDDNVHNAAEQFIVWGESEHLNLHPEAAMVAAHVCYEAIDARPER